MGRPVGVTVIAIICFLVATYEVLSGIRLLARGGVMAALSGPPELRAGLFLLIIIFPALYALAGWGLWKVKSWGRILTLFLLVVGFAFVLVLWLLTPHFKMSGFLETVVSLALYGVTAWYLFKPNVKAAFEVFGNYR